MPGVENIVDVVANAARLVSALRARGLPVVIATNDLNDPRPAARPIPAVRARVPDEFLAVVGEIGSAPADITVVRGGWSAFSGTGLDRILRDRDVTEVVIVGLATNFGVESTARAAYDLGYHVVVASDAVTSPVADVHQSALNGTIPALGKVATTDEVLALLNNAGIPPV